MEQYPEIFADELAGMMLGYPVSKLTFVTATQSGENGTIEKTKVLSLAIPTQSLLNSCKLILDNALENQELIISMASVSEEKVLAVLSTVSAISQNTTEVKKKTKAPKKSPTS